MRKQWKITVLALALGVLGILAGCGGHEQPPGFQLRGTVVTDGVPTSTASVTLYANGQPVAQCTAANGTFRLANIPAGTYVLAVAAGLSNLQSYVGPFPVTTNQQLTITAPTAADLGSPAVAPSTTTLVVAANDLQSHQLQSFQVTVGTQRASGAPQDTGWTATVTGIAVPAAPVVVTNTVNNLRVTLPHLPLTANTVAYMQAVLPAGG